MRTSTSGFAVMQVHKNIWQESTHTGCCCIHHSYISTAASCAGVGLFDSTPSPPFTLAQQHYWQQAAACHGLESTRHVSLQCSCCGSYVSRMRPARRLRSSLSHHGSSARVRARARAAARARTGTGDRAARGAGIAHGALAAGPAAQREQPGGGHTGAEAGRR